MKIENTVSLTNSDEILRTRAQIWADLGCGYLGSPVKYLFGTGSLN
jgi:hypothetical protein